MISFRKFFLIKRKSLKGFTLIELLVVIAIIAILAAVVLAALTGPKDKANKAAVIKKMRGVIPILNMCANDGGFAFSTKSSQAGGSAVSISENTTCLCQKTQDNSAANSPSLTCFANSTLKWPKLTDVGWRYCKNSDSPALCSMAKGMLSDSSYVYQVTNGTDVVTCTFDTGNCQ